MKITLVTLSSLVDLIVIPIFVNVMNIHVRYNNDCFFHRVFVFVYLLVLACIIITSLVWMNDALSRGDLPMSSATRHSATVSLFVRLLSSATPRVRQKFTMKLLWRQWYFCIFVCLFSSPSSLSSPSSPSYLEDGIEAGVSVLTPDKGLIHHNAAAAVY